ncbi:MAG: cupin domain-containing protein [Acidimicrobiia bacterium]|nr:cupin domain-containing protein [Acidimicrobiia bacterium]
MAKLVRFDEAPQVARGEGIASVQLTDPPLAGQEFTMGVTSFPPGTSIALHCHNTIEQVTLIEGEGVVELNGEQIPVRPYDTTQVAPGEFHRFINTGSSTMRILWVYGATHVTRTFADGSTVEQFEQSR